jgi:F-box-like
MDQATVKMSEFDRDPPISRIPHEILAMIFVSTQTEKLHGLPLGQQQLRIPIEIAVSHVSTFWRDAAIDTPSLWTKVLVHSAQPSELIQIYLTRSKTYLLDLVVNHGTNGFVYISDTCLNMIVSHIDRLRSLHVMGSINKIYTTLSLFHNLAAPQLKELVLRGRGLEWHPYHHTPHVFAGGAPALSSLRLDGIGLRTCMPPLSAITSMSLHDIQLSGLWKYQHFLTVLSATPLLAELSIHGLLVDHWDAQANGPVHLHSLRSLWLSGTDSHVSHILYSLSLPHIEFLSLCLPTPSPNERAFLLNSTGAPRYPTVRSLVFTLIISPSRFPTLFPSLTHLSILHCNSLVALQQVFTVSILAMPLPDLETLTVFPLHQSNWQMMCNLVNLRIRQGFPLRKLRLDYESWSLFPPESAETLNGQVEVEVLMEAPTDHEMVW